MRPKTVVRDPFTPRSNPKSRLGVHSAPITSAKPGDGTRAPQKAATWGAWASGISSRAVASRDSE